MSRAYPRALLRARLERGDSITEIAADAGVCTGTISRWARALGLPPRRPGHLVAPDEVEERRRLVAAHGCHEAARILGLAPHTLTKWCHRRGIASPLPPGFPGRGGRTTAPRPRLHTGCLVAGCPGEHAAHGVCRRHYTAAWRLIKQGLRLIKQGLVKPSPLQREAFAALPAAVISAWGARAQVAAIRRTA